MNFRRRKHFPITLVAVCLCFFSQMVLALRFEPGIGVGAEYTNNASLAPENTVNDLITVGYIGGRLSETEGALVYDATVTSNNISYTQDTFPDQRYFNVAATAGWAMIKERVDWFAGNYFQQRPIRSINSTTPDNLQDSNVFNFGANLRVPISARQSITVRPVYSQYYYEVQTTDNNQLGISANWYYQVYRRTGIGFDLSTRTINYTEKNIVGDSIAGTTFTNIAFLINGVQRRSTYSVNLGSTAVKREGGRESSGFTGSVNVLVDLTTRSKFSGRLSTNVTDTSSVITSAINDPINGNPDDVQIATDVIRNSIFNLAYLREDASLHSRLWWEYREVKYSNSPLDRTIRSLGLQMDYPLTQLLSSGLRATYNRTRQLDTKRLDDRYTVGANLHYRMSRKLFAAMDLTYRKKESTSALENYDEIALFVRVVYGFGDVQRPSRTGVF